jgi:nitroreductase
MPTLNTGSEDVLARRWSPRAFSAKPVEQEKLLRHFEAARWAPSSGNDQPWNFVFATVENSAEHGRLASCLNERNHRWAGLAPVLMFSVARMRFICNGNENRHAFHDLGMAVGNMLVQATAMGLYVHQMAGFDRDAARQKLGIPEGHEPVAAIALGYPGDLNDLLDDLRKRELAPR